MSPRSDNRLALEQKLLEQVRTAQESYSRAAAEHRKVLEARNAGLIEANLDGSQLLHASGAAEHDALVKYSMAVKALADAVLRHGEPSAIPEPVPVLTPRERQVLALIANGLSSKEVAHQLGITFRTAVCHRYRVMQKLQVHNVAGLVQYAIYTGAIRRGGSVNDASL